MKNQLKDLKDKIKEENPKLAMEEVAKKASEVANSNGQNGTNEEGSDSDEVEKDAYSKALSQLLKIVDQKCQHFYEYKNLETKIEEFIEEMPHDWQESIQKRVKLQEIFNGIENDIKLLQNWRGGNPWGLLRKRADHLEKAGFLNYASKKELDKINSNSWQGHYVSLARKRKWTKAVVPIPEHSESPITAKVFMELHRLRRACKKQYESYKQKR